MNHLGITTLLTAALIVAACGAPTTAERIEHGRILFSRSEDDGYACSDCHPVASSPADRIFPGHALTTPALGEAWWPMYLSGARRTQLNAALLCRAKYQTLEFEDLEKLYRDSASMDPTRAWDESSRLAIQSFLENLGATSEGPVRKYEFAYDPDDRSARKAYVQRILSLPADPEKGRALFNRGCAWCHGQQGEGVDGKGQPMKLKPHKRDVIIEQVRHGGYRMPFFQEDRLSDPDLAHLVGYVVELLARRRSMP